jgi:Asp-tRNA(Asn)/Glu-tRNA(Gln) amidotransferase A subunit family amidase
MGITPAGLGTDTVGSMRVPATCNGVVGFKPTIGRWPADFGIKTSNAMDTVGPFALCMEDIAILDEIVSDNR